MERGIARLRTVMIPNNVLSPLEQIAQIRGLTLDQLMAEAPVEESGRASKYEEVREGPELRRILALPRRPQAGELPEAKTLASFLTERLAIPGKQLYPGPLRPLQAIALQEAWAAKGGLFPMRVGSGKSLTSALLPTILGAKRPIYVCPANLRDQMRREFVKFSKCWSMAHPDAFTILSYEKIGHPDSGVQQDSTGKVLRAALLDRLAGDLIILDEAHKVSNTRAAVTRRVKRYCEQNPNTIVVAMSGTMIRRSLKDFAHILKWTHKNDSPLPLVWGELEMWSEALDEKTMQFGPRCLTGALSLFFSDQDKQAARTADEDETRVIARAAVSRRLNETRGVVSSNDGPLSIPLEFHPWGPAREDQAINEHFTILRSRWEIGEITIADGLELARAASALGCGFYQTWSPRGPEEWMGARKNWTSFCRQVVVSNRRGWDSESAVKRVIKTGLLQDHGILASWEAIMPTFIPNPVTVWVSDEAIRAGEAWLKDHSGILWTRHVELGVRLGKDLGLTYYGRDGKDEKGNFIADHKPGQSMVASIQSSGTGRNLQAWSEALWYSPPDEQGAGRQHRDGSTADLVRHYVYAGCREHVASWWSQVAKAKMAEKLPGSPQKLCYGQSTIPTIEEVELKKTVRWVK